MFWVSEALGGDLHAHSCLQHGSCVPVPEVVQAKLWESGFADCPAKALGHVLGDERPADLVGKDVTLPLPEPGGTALLLGSWQHA